MSLIPILMSIDLLAGYLRKPVVKGKGEFDESHLHFSGDLVTPKRMFRRCQ